MNISTFEKREIFAKDLLEDDVVVTRGKSAISFTIAEVDSEEDSDYIFVETTKGLWYSFGKTEKVYIIIDSQIYPEEPQEPMMPKPMRAIDLLELTKI